MRSRLKTEAGFRGNLLAEQIVEHFPHFFLSFFFFLLNQYLVPWFPNLLVLFLSHAPTRKQQLCTIRPTFERFKRPPIEKAGWFIWLIYILFYDIDILSHVGVEQAQQSMLYQMHPLLLFFNESGGWWYVERPSTPPRALSIQSCTARRFKHPSLSASQAHLHGDPAHSGPNWSAPLKMSNHLQSDRAGKQWWEMLKHTHSVSIASLYFANRMGEQ